MIVNEAVQMIENEHAPVAGKYERFVVKPAKPHIVIANNLCDGIVTEQIKNVKPFLLIRSRRESLDPVPWAQKLFERTSPGTRTEQRAHAHRRHSRAYGATRSTRGF